MKLSQLAAKPQLIQVEIDDETIVTKYGEPIEFWIYDRYDMDVYMQLLNTEEKDVKGLTNVIKKMLFNEKGEPAIEEGEILPSDILMKCVEKVIGFLGNSMTQTLTK